MSPAEAGLSDARHRAIFEQRIAPTLFAEARPAAQPRAILFGGQPGAGKSASVAAAVDELKAAGGAVAIVGDDLRGFHPRYAALLRRDDKTAAAHTDQDVARWIEMAIERARAQRVNVVIEGTMRDVGKVATTATGLREAGYLVEARALAVHERWSWLGVLQRYEAQRAERAYGRMTTPQSHAAGYAGVPVTLQRLEEERLVDRIVVMRRGGQVLYSNDLVDGRWQQAPRARQALEAERSRPMRPTEAADYLASVQKLQQRLDAPARRASPAELQVAAQLLDQAKALQPPTAYSAGRNDARSPGTSLAPQNKRGRSL